MTRGSEDTLLAFGVLKTNMHGGRGGTGGVGWLEGDSSRIFPWENCKNLGRGNKVQNISNLCNQ